MEVLSEKDVQKIKQDFIAGLSGMAKTLGPIFEDVARSAREVCQSFMEFPYKLCELAYLLEHSKLPCGRAKTKRLKKKRKKIVMEWVRTQRPFEWRGVMDEFDRLGLSKEDTERLREAGLNASAVGETISIEHIRHLIKTTPMAASDAIERAISSLCEETPNV